MVKEPDYFTKYNHVVTYTTKQITFKMNQYSIFHIDGGLGKHIAATAVAQCIKNNYPDRQLIVVCGYPEIFLNLPFVDRVYRNGITPYFYQDFVQNQDSLIFKYDPYFTTEHIHKKLDLITNWCKLFGLSYSGETPQLQFNIRQRQVGYHRWKREKPVLVLHTNGGPMHEQHYNYSWTRDMPFPIMEKIIQTFSKDYHIMQICRNTDQAIYPGVEPVTDQLSNMEFLSLLLTSAKRVLIDSCLQHAAAALNLPSTVLWVGTSPEVFGYAIHNNFKATIPESVKLPDSYLFDYNFHGTLHECPLLDLNVFDEFGVINSIHSM
jgi:hypothetical protein